MEISITKRKYLKDTFQLKNIFFKQTTMAGNVVETHYINYKHIRIPTHRINAALNGILVILLWLVQLSCLPWLSGTYTSHNIQLATFQHRIVSLFVEDD